MQNNIWFNKDKSFGINLNLVVAWRMSPRHELTIFLNGGEFNFSGEEAVEIYNMLTPKKEII